MKQIKSAAKKNTFHSQPSNAQPQIPGENYHFHSHHQTVSSWAHRTATARARTTSPKCHQEETTHLQIPSAKIQHQ